MLGQDVVDVPRRFLCIPVPAFWFQLQKFRRVSPVANITRKYSARRLNNEKRNIYAKKKSELQRRVPSKTEPRKAPEVEADRGTKHPVDDSDAAEKKPHKKVRQGR